MSSRTLPPSLQPVLAGMALMLAVLAVYWPCLNGEFVWDDKDWTTAASWFLQDASGLWQIWTEPTAMQQYFPVTATSFWLDHYFWEWWTLPYHLENVLLHGLSCVLFWRCLKALDVRGAWFAAALLAVHPVMTESVAWITERKNALCLTLFLSSFMSYGNWVNWWKQEPAVHRRWHWYAIALVVFLAAMLAKVTAYVLPPTLLLITWWKCGTIRRRRDVFPTLPFFVIAVAIGLLISWIETNHVGAKGQHFDLAPGNRMIIAGQALWFYAAKLIWPHPICILYYKWQVDWRIWWHWLGVAGVLAAGIALWRTRNKLSRGAIAAVCFYLGSLFPVLGFLNVYGMKYSWVADRWVYLPSLAVLAGLAHLGATCCAAVPLRAKQILAALLLAVFGTLTWAQSSNYRTIDTFWNAAIAGNASPWKAHNDYSAALLNVGRYEEAAAHLREAVRLAPDYADAHANLGNVLIQLHQPEAALKSYDRALELEPTLAPVHFNIGVVSYESGNLDKAEIHLRKAIELDPQFTPAHNDLGNVLFLKGKPDEAAEHFRIMLERRPDHPGANTSLGNIAFQKGKHAEAIAYYERALAKEPTLIAALSNCAWILATSSDASVRNGNRAMELAKRAVELSGDNDPAMLTALAAAYAETGQYVDASVTASKALRLAAAQGKSGMASDLRYAISLYESGKPYREVGTTP